MTKLLLSLMLVLPIMTFADPAVAENDPLAQYQWERRLLFVFADRPADRNYQEQMLRIGADLSGVEERHIDVFIALAKKRVVMGDQNVTPRRLRNILGLSLNGFGVVLVGKDGGVKLRSRTPVSLQTELYPLIDAMPMRRDEMRKQQKKDP